MISSLRVRLLLAFVLMVMVTLGTVAVLSSHIFVTEFRSYIERDILRNRQVVQTLITYSRGDAKAHNAQAFVSELHQILDEDIVLTDQGDQVLAASNPNLVGKKLDWEAADNAAIIITSPFTEPMSAEMAPGHMLRPPPFHTDVIGHGEILFMGVPVRAVSLPFTGTSRIPVGYTPPPFTVRRLQGEALDPIAAGFVHSVNRSLAVAVSVAGLAAVLMTIAVSRRILGPIETLTAAARQMEKGDLSQRVKVHSRDEIGELTHAFNAMADGLTRLEELRRHMVTDVAHELRTPLTNIRGYLEALRDRVVKPTPLLIDSLHEEAMLINRLIDDLQELALAEAGQLRLVRQRMALGPVVEQAVSAVLPASAEKELTLDLVIPPGLPEVDADGERIGQVLRNLLANAIRHTPHGGSIQVVASASDEAVSVSVRDTGCGIDPQALPYIFERFYRADPSRSRATGGAGLGLAIAKQLIDLHEGNIWAESVPGEGAIFTFRLPLSQDRSSA